jgi:hypothetical protein
VITGKVTTNDGAAADFPPDELVKYLGGQFSSFATQLEQIRTEKASVEDQLSAMTQEAVEAKARIQGLIKEAAIAHDDYEFALASLKEDQSVKHDTDLAASALA